MKLSYLKSNGFNEDVYNLYNLNKNVPATRLPSSRIRCPPTPGLLPSSPASTTRTNDHQPRKQWRQQWWFRITMPHLRKRYWQHSQKENRMCYHRLVPRFVLPYWSCLVLSLLHRQLQGHWAGLCEMPNSQIQGCGKLLLIWYLWFKKLSLFKKNEKFHF